MQPTLLRAIAAGFAVALTASAARAQCPDGTPPPCAARTVARAAAVSVPSPNDRARRFIILPFRNVTRQAEQDWLVEGSTTMLADALNRWQGISVVPDERLYPALKRAGILPGSVIDPPRVRRISEETGGWTAVTGEVIATGGRLRVTARAWDVPTQRELMRAASEVSSGGDVRLAYDSVSLQLLGSAGFEAGTADLAEATTRNLDAYRAYLRGLAHQRKSELKSALTAFQEAVRADSSFALAWARLAEIQLGSEPASILNPMNQGGQSAARAVALSAKLPRRPRQLVVAIDAAFRAQFGDARTALEGLLAADSNDVEAMEQLVGIEMFDPLLVPVKGGMRPRGSPNRAARLAKQVVTLDPDRHSMFGLLASVYASAGVPGAGSSYGVDRAPSSIQDLMQLLQQPEHRRIYASVFRGDSIALVPAESLAAVPKDSLRASQRAARTVARAWAERWVSVAMREAAPHQLISELYAYDGEYAVALRAVAQAESLGVQTPTWSPPARRMLFLGKAGDFTAAGRLADSLTSAGFFANPNNAITNRDAESWAFGLHVLAGRVSQAATLLEQATALVRMFNPTNSMPILSAYRNLMGNGDPEEEPGMPRAMRAQQLDSALAHLMAFAASDRIGPLLPTLLPDLAELADQQKSRSAELLKAAQTLAAAGRDSLAFELASNAVVSDSTLAPAAAAFPWYRAGAEALHAVRLATQARFRAGVATVTGDRAAFEWKVDDATPFTWNRPETPAGRAQYRWDVELEADGRYYHLRAAASVKDLGVAPASGTLANLLPPNASRWVSSGALDAKGVRRDTTLLQGVTLRTEISPGVLRLVVNDPAVLEWLRRTRPAQARFRYYPCARPVNAAEQCVDERVTISYP